MALVLAEAFLEKFGGDALEDIQTSYDAWRDRQRARFSPAR
jgi:hypothetical protein